MPCTLHVCSQCGSTSPIQCGAAAHIPAPPPPLFPPSSQVESELAPLRVAKREEALRRIDDEIGAEARALKEQVVALKAEAEAARRQMGELDQKVGGGGDILDQKA